MCRRQVCRREGHDYVQEIWPTELLLSHPQCSCFCAGCQCLREWNYTSSKGNTFHVSSGCANPDGDQPVPWCMVDPTTCAHEPIAAETGGFWDQCYSAGDSITIDTGAWAAVACSASSHTHAWGCAAYGASCSKNSHPSSVLTLFCCDGRRAFWLCAGASLHSNRRAADGAISVPSCKRHTADGGGAVSLLQEACC